MEQNFKYYCDTMVDAFLERLKDESEWEEIGEKLDEATIGIFEQTIEDMGIDINAFREIADITETKMMFRVNFKDGTWVYLRPNSQEACESEKGGYKLETPCKAEMAKFIDMLAPSDHTGEPMGLQAVLNDVMDATPGGIESYWYDKWDLPDGSHVHVSTIDTIESWYEPGNPCERCEIEEALADEKPAINRVVKPEVNGLPGPALMDIMDKVTQALLGNEQYEEAKEFLTKANDCLTQDELMSVSQDYVNFRIY